MKTEIDALPYILRVEEVAAVLRISRSGAYALMHSQGFPVTYIGQKSMRVRRDDLLEYLSRQANSGGDHS